MSKSNPYLIRDLSWLAFNERVLQEAKDKNVPILERIKFLAIYSSNLEEFFKVRMASLKSIEGLKKKERKELAIANNKEIIELLQNEVNAQQGEFTRIFEFEIIPELKEQGIQLKKWHQLSEEQIAFVEQYFEDNMLPFVQPMLLNKQKIRPFLVNAALYFAVYLEDENKGSTKYAIVKIPNDYLPRFIELPTKKGQHDVIMLDDVVRRSINKLFPGYNIKDSFSIKLTRDAELYIDDEYSGDLVEKIRKQLAKRNLGNATRFVYDREMPNEMLAYLMKVFNLNKHDLQPEGRYHSNFDFFKFPSFGKDHLQNKPLPPLEIEKYEDGRPIFDHFKNQDILFHYPYETYEYVIRFFENAADDPAVEEILITQYRVASKSRIMQALIKAAKAGKKVTAFVEVKARFDEEANLRWARRLENAGIKVLYSFPGLKVHAKLGLVVKVENGKKKRFAYLSTGNFHEKTAKLYCDYGLLTADNRLTKEVELVFEFLENAKKPDHTFKHLLVGQINLRHQLTALIDAEIKAAKAGKKAHIILKMNSLEDRLMIDKLYEASQAGVKIELIIRGIFCLVPNRKGLSENISAISILDRYLEHARIFYFYANGEEKVYLSSADLMRRNLSFRVETSFPVYDKALKQEIIDGLQIQLSDNMKARILDENLKNKYKKSKGKRVQAQLATYNYLKKKHGIE